MLIGEVATIAHVSPRAIRHYHREGVLPEPARASNGYRTYSAMDLARLLRIRRLVTLGLPLHRIGALLRDEPDDLLDDLAALESDLLEQIDRMRRQLDAVRAARASSSPDSVALYDSDHEALRGLWALPEVRRIERDMSLMLMSAGTDELRETLTAGFRDESRMHRLGALSEQLRAIDEDSSQAERDGLVAALTRVLAQWRGLEAQPRLTGLVHDYLERAFTPAQLDVVWRAAKHVEDGAPPA